jgi:membrane protein YqaA with SNARE-associated domain
VEMSTLAWIVIAWAVAFVANVIPAFMPPTWSILGFFYVHYGLPLLPLTIGGAVASSLGRLVLALASRSFGWRFLSAERQRNLRHLGTWLDRRPSWQVPLTVLVFSLGPIPSNQIFIAAGLTGMNLRPVVGGFFVGRVISYTAAAVLLHVAAERIEDALLRYWNNTSALAIQVLMLAAVVAFTLVDWPKLLHLPTEPPEGPESPSDSPNEPR